MERIDQILNSPVAAAIGWGLLHTLWQGLLIVLILSLVKLLFVTDKPRRNYSLYSVALLVQTVWLVVTVAGKIGTASTLSAASTDISGLTLVLSPGSASGDSTFFERLISSVNSEMPVLFMLWLAGIIFLSFRFTGGLLQIHFLKTKYIEPVGENLQGLFDTLCRRLEVSSAKIFMSTKVGIPAVVGFIKPVVLVPVGIITNLSPEQVETLLIHELIHVKRNDYLMNIIQSVAEIVLFFNPFTWWISKNIREERERACDDMVLTYSNRLDYARALVAAKEWEMHFQLTIGVHSGKGELQNRINRIMGKFKSQKRNYSFKKMMAYMVVLATLAITVAFSSRKNEKMQIELPSGDNYSLSTLAPFGEDAGFSEELQSESPRSDGTQQETKEKPTQINTKIKTIAPRVDSEITKSVVTISPKIVTAKLDSPDLSLQLQKLLEDMKKHQKEWQAQLEEDRARLEEQLGKIKVADLSEEDQIRLKALEEMQKVQFNFPQQEMENIQEQIAKLNEEMEQATFGIQEMAEKQNMEEIMKKEQEKMMQMEQQMKETQARMEKCSQELKEQAIKDGYLKSKEDKLNFSWEDDGLYINHEKVKKEDEEKYQKIWKKYFNEDGRGKHFYQ